MDPSDSVASVGNNASSRHSDNADKNTETLATVANPSEPEMELSEPSQKALNPSRPRYELYDISKLGPPTDLVSAAVKERLDQGIAAGKALTESDFSKYSRDPALAQDYKDMVVGYTEFLTSMATILKSRRLTHDEWKRLGVIPWNFKADTVMGLGNSAEWHRLAFIHRDMQQLDDSWYLSPEAERS